MNHPTPTILEATAARQKIEVEWAEQVNSVMDLQRRLAIFSDCYRFTPNNKNTALYLKLVTKLNEAYNRREELSRKLIEARRIELEAKGYDFSK